MSDFTCTPTNPSRLTTQGMPATHEPWSPSECACIPQLCSRPLAHSGSQHLALGCVAALPGHGAHSARQRPHAPLQPLQPPRSGANYERLAFSTCSRRRRHARPRRQGRRRQRHSAISRGPRCHPAPSRHPQFHSPHRRHCRAQHLRRRPPTMTDSAHDHHPTHAQRWHTAARIHLGCANRGVSHNEPQQQRQRPTGYRLHRHDPSVAL